MMVSAMPPAQVATLAPAGLTRAVDAVIDRAVAERRLAGAVVMIALDGRIVYARAAGYADVATRRAMQLDERFRYASMTKPIVTATALRLIERGTLAPDAPVSRYLPYFTPRLADGSTPVITVRDLMLHASGLNYRSSEPADGPYHRLGVSDGTDQPGLGMTANLKRIAGAPLINRPGTQWVYSLSIDVLGGVIEAATHERLDTVVSRLVTGPLGMRDTDFTARDGSRLATPTVNTPNGPVTLADDSDVALGELGTEHFAPSRLFNPDTYNSGGSGLVGTARDYVRFLEAVRTGGGGVIGAASAHAMLRDQLGAHGIAGGPGPGWGFAYGFGILEDPKAEGGAGNPQSVGTIRWAGIYGNNCFMDPRRRLTVVALTNTMPEGVSGAFPTALRDAIYAALPPLPPR